MIKKTIILLLLGCFFLARAQTNQLSIKSKRFGVFAGIGLTNAVENNTVINWPRFANFQFNFKSKPSFEAGVNYTIPVVENLVSFNSELGILTGGYIQNETNQSVEYVNTFETLSLKNLAVFNLPLINENEYFQVGLGPSLYFTSSDSKTELIVNSYNVGNMDYSNKFFLGAKAFIGITKNNSAIKFNYNWFKATSVSRDIPFAPFYTMGITYEHKIF